MPMKSVKAGRLIAGRGLEGDRYCAAAGGGEEAEGAGGGGSEETNGKGTYSVLVDSMLHPGRREPGRQLTVMSADVAEAALSSAGVSLPSSASPAADGSGSEPGLGLALGLGALRRNIVVRGEDLGQQLLKSMGRVLRLGRECRVLIHRNCVPCQYNERRNAMPGLVEALWDSAGVSCEILTGGTIAVGDDVVLTDETAVVDGGTKPPGFYVRPSKRTAAMVREGLEMMRAAKEKYKAADPEGYHRAEASYESVGLKFWPGGKD